MSKPPPSVSRLQALLGRVPSTGDPDNVVRLPEPTLDELEQGIIQAMNNLVHWEAEAARVEIAFNDAYHKLGVAQKRFTDRCRELGANVVFPERGGPIQGEMRPSTVPADE